MSGSPPTPRDQLIALSTLPEGPRGTVHQISNHLAGRGPRPTNVERGLQVRVQAVLAKATEVARRQEERGDELGATITTLLDDAYPSSLRPIEGAPTVLYVRGTIPDREAIAIVGSRRPDSYGLEVADLFARELARAGLVVVSGFARGIDAAAHRACLLARSPTVAFLGCGLDVDYPRGHRDLADEIADRGAVVSEFPFGRLPDRWHFPVRNRSIAASSLATLVIQATLGSGSLSTAHQALELGRDVFAVPGRILDELSQGTNGLIRDGAGLAQHPDDVLEALGRASGPAARRPPEGRPGLPSPDPIPTDLGEEARRVLEALRERASMPVDDLVARLSAPTDGLLAVLLELELRGLVRRGPGPNYSSALW